MLLNEVNVIESATFPLKKYVITPDVVPPGQAAIIMSPTFKGIGISENQEIKNAITGNMIIWEARPVTRDFGNRNRFLKFPGVKEIPTPTMIRARITLNKMSLRVYECRSTILINRLRNYAIYDTNKRN